MPNTLFEWLGAAATIVGGFVALVQLAIWLRDSGNKGLSALAWGSAIIFLFASLISLELYAAGAWVPPEIKSELTLLDSEKGEFKISIIVGSYDRRLIILLSEIVLNASIIILAICIMVKDGMLTWYRDMRWNALGFLFALIYASLGLALPLILIIPVFILISGSELSKSVDGILPIISFVDFIFVLQAVRARGGWRELFTDALFRLLHKPPPYDNDLRGL